MSSANICINSDALRVAKALTKRENEVLKKTNKFKDALDAVNNGVLRGSDINEIRLALKIADAVTGEPSEEAVNLGWIEAIGGRSKGKAMENAFRAMIEQMIREIGYE